MIKGLNKAQAQAVVHHGKPLLVVAGAGCVSGGTEIPFNRGGKGFRCTIRQAYRAFHQLNSQMWDLTIPTFVRSFTGERVRLHQIRNIVKSGKKQTYWLKLENGLRLRATFDHLIFTKRGFVQLGDLRVDDFVACDSSFQYQKFNHGRLVFVRVDSIVKSDVRMTYDIQCESPHHNFVANGMVIHNSGKTRVLTHRVAHLIKHHGIIPTRLFVTTFTNKAADEMQERLLPMIGERKADRLKIGTFHSLCRRILLDVLERGSRESFVTPKLLMGGGRFFKSMMWFKQAGFDGRETKAALHQISWWKNEGVTVEQALEFRGLDAHYAKFYDVYQKQIVDAEMIDFDDMLFRTYYELIDPKNEKFLDRLQSRIDHVLVDEGQDLNKIQFMLTKLLAHKHQQVTLVADDWQVLYGFRGAKVKYLFEFIDWFQPEQIKLEQNYRSTKVIVEYGNKLIANNKDQIKKILFTENDQGDKPQLLVSFNPDAEAEAILDIVDELVSVEGFQLGDIALIYRTNSQSRALVDILVRNQTPHKVHSRFGFYDRSEIKDIVTYLRVCSNPYAAELEDFRRIINRPTRYLGHVFITKAEEHQIDNGQDTFWEGLLDFVANGEMPRNQQQNAEDFVGQIQDVYNWKNQDHRTTGDLVNHILSVIPYREWMEAKEEEDGDEDEPDNDRKLNVESLLVGAARFPNVDDFLTFIDSMKKNDDKEDDAEVIHLMTIHKSKGLEFPVVFVVGCSDKLLPHYRAEDPEEERRCCYVAVTRAKERLFLSAIHGKYSRLNVTVSPFLKEMGVDIPVLEHRVLGGGMESRVIGSIARAVPMKVESDAVLLVNDDTPPNH